MPKYISFVRDVHDTYSLDNLMHRVVQHLKATVLGPQPAAQHLWFRVALTCSDHVSATIFDDLTQVPAALVQRSLGQASSSFKLLRDVNAHSGMLRTPMALKNTVMKITVQNRQQVMIPDVQKLINQSGNVSTDLFNTRLIKPPTSVLIFPLKSKQHNFGVVFCMSSVPTDFSDTSPKLREVCDLAAPHLLHVLNAHMAHEYGAMQVASQAAGRGSNSSSADKLEPLVQRNSSAIKLGSRAGLNGAGDGSLAGGADSFNYAQSRSFTGALVTGLTEKLNQKRIKSTMDWPPTASLADLQLLSLLGEGGFAKVFRGRWRGLVVGIKVVCDDGRNEKMVMKNAHEIAILSSLSHPNIVQAYNCLTDVPVRDILAHCTKTADAKVLGSPAFKYLQARVDKAAHVEIIEYCDLGSLSSAINTSVFHVRAQHVAVPPVPPPGGGAAPAAGDPLAGGGAAAGKPLAPKLINMTKLLLTLIEVASAMGYLHSMGVVHCDLKPANVLLKFSNHDSRGFTAKVSDFGLSRVEDDETCSSFPFNSCGTAAYVAPEALISNKKVNSSVDVYAFGILMWEMYTGHRPYGSMKQQQLVEEVVMRGLRPRFPATTPAAYTALAQSCWNGSAAARPSFDQINSNLNAMLQCVQQATIPECVNSSFPSTSADQTEYSAAPATLPRSAGGAASSSSSSAQRQASSSSAAAASSGGGGARLPAQAASSSGGSSLAPSPVPTPPSTTMAPVGIAALAPLPPPPPPRTPTPQLHAAAAAAAVVAAAHTAGAVSQPPPPPQPAHTSPHRPASDVGPHHPSPSL